MLGNQLFTNAMPRPTIATSADVRSAVLALLLEAGIGESPSEQGFRRAVSVRKVRARLGGGNPSTIGREIHAVEAELVRSGMSKLALPELPPDIADLMAKLWQAAVAVQLDDVLALKAQAQAVADDARQSLTESQLRCDVLMQELGLLRVAIVERDERLALAQATQASLQTQLTTVNAELQASQLRAEQLASQLSVRDQTLDAAITTARDRYDGLAKQLMLETGQQRQAAHAESSRLASQLKFAEKREAAQSERVAHVEAELQEVRAQRDQALGEVSALKYVNTALRAQLDAIMSHLPQPIPSPKVRGLASARKRPAKSAASGSATKRGKPQPLS